MGKERGFKPTDRDRSILKGNVNEGYSIVDASGSHYVFWASDEAMKKAGIGEKKMPKGVPEMIDLIVLNAINHEVVVEHVTELIQQLRFDDLKLINDGKGAYAVEPKNLVFLPKEEPNP